MTPLSGDPLKSHPAPDGVGVDLRLTAILIGVGVVSAPLRTQGRPLRLPLMYYFAMDYLARVEVIRLHGRSRLPLVLTRSVLCQTLLERYESDRQQKVKRAEAEVASAVRRRRAWMTANGERHLGVGADAECYRSAAVKVGDRLIVAMVPGAQETIELRLTTSYTNQAIYGASPTRPQDRGDSQTGAAEASQGAR